MGAGGTPTNEVIKSIGTGKDHTTIEGWAAATENDCVNGWTGDYSSPCSPVGELYDEDFAPDVSLSGATTDSTHYRRLSVASTERHSGDFPKVDSGAKITGQVTVDEGYFELEWMIVDEPAAYPCVDIAGGQDVLLRGIIALAAATQYSAFQFTPGDGLNPVFENCIGIATRNHGSANAFVGGFNDGGVCRNCTGWLTGGVQTDEVFSYAACSNCIGISAAKTNGCYVSCTGDYNISADQTAPGGPPNSIYDETAAGLFADTTAGAEDLHLKATATSADDAGDDLSAYFTDDIDGETRSDWDIGADEVVSAAGLSIPIAMHHYKQLMGAN